MSIPVHKSGMSLGESHHWNHNSISRGSGSQTSNGSMPHKSFVCHLHTMPRLPILILFFTSLDLFSEMGHVFAACFLASLFFIHARFLHSSAVNSTTFQQTDFQSTSSTLATVPLRAGRTVLYDFHTGRTLKLKLYREEQRLRVRLHNQFSGMPGLPNFPEKMAYVIHTKYQYRGKSHNLRSNEVWILRFLIRSLSQNLRSNIVRILTPNHMVNYFQSVTAQT